ncbi:retrovirus-related pol polyprotein from transposon TNT 1-94 [Tanacetum coccineum]
MTTLAKFMIFSGADNRPPMLEKSLYESWKSRMELYMENREHERMILDSVLNGPLIWPTVVQEDGTTGKKMYAELSATIKIQADCDLKATNIVLQGLPPDEYAIVNHHKVAKEIWDRVKLLMQGTKLSFQEKECLLVPVFSQGDDPIACLNKAMAFLTTVASLRFPSTNNQLRTSFNPRNQATILDGRGNATSSGGNNTGGQARVMKCYNFQGEGHMTEDINAYDSDCDDVFNAKAVLMANLFNYGSDIISKSELINATTITNATTIALAMFKLDIEPLSYRLKNNKDAHEDYLKKTIENTDTIRGLVERVRKRNPSEPLLDTACKFTKHVQELLVYVSQTCPSFTKPSEKLVVVKPMNKVKKVRFSKPLTSSSNIHKQVESFKTPESNTHVLPSTGLKSSTSASRSQPTCNKKNDRISQTPSSNMKNKVEVQCRRVKSKSTKKNHVKDPICEVNVKHTMITPTKVVQLKETTSNSVETPKPEIKVYRKRPKQIKTIGSSKKAKLVESKISNNSEPNHSWGSNATDVPSSSSLVNDRLSRLFSSEERNYLKGSRDTKLYTISLDDMLKTSPICLLLKALKTKSWLWHRQLSYLNFGSLNKLAKDGLARGIPKLKFKKDHLCSACALGKINKSSHQPKAEDTNQ